MIRIFLGLILAFGTAGGLDSLPPDASAFSIMSLIGLSIGSILLMFWGLKGIQK